MVEDLRDVVLVCEADDGGEFAEGADRVPSCRVLAGPGIEEGWNMEGTRNKSRPLTVRATTEAARGEGVPGPGENRRGG